MEVASDPLISRPTEDYYDVVAPLVESTPSDHPLNYRYSRLVVHYFTLLNKNITNDEALPLEDLDKLILDKKINVAAVNRNGWTLVHLAVERNNAQLLLFLISHKAPVSIADFNGDTPLRIAARKNLYLMAEILLLHGAAVNELQRGTETTPLHVAAYHGSLETVEVLLLYGADPNVISASGNTPGHVAGYRGHYGIVTTLIAYKLDTSIKNGAGVSVNRMRDHSKGRFKDAVMKGIWRMNLPELRMEGTLSTVEMGVSDKKKVKVRVKRTFLRIKETHGFKSVRTVYQWYWEMKVVALTDEILLIELPKTRQKLEINVPQCNAKFLQKIIMQNITFHYPSYDARELVESVETSKSKEYDELVDHYEAHVIKIEQLSSELTSERSWEVAQRMISEEFKKLGHVRKRLEGIVKVCKELKENLALLNLVIEIRINAGNKVIEWYADNDETDSALACRFVVETLKVEASRVRALALMAQDAFSTFKEKMDRWRTQPEQIDDSAPSAPCEEDGPVSPMAPASPLSAAPSPVSSPGPLSRKRSREHVRVPSFFAVPDLQLVAGDEDENKALPMLEEDSKSPGSPVMSPRRRSSRGSRHSSVDLSGSFRRRSSVGLDSDAESAASTPIASKGIRKREIALPRENLEVKALEEEHSKFVENSKETKDESEKVPDETSTDCVVCMENKRTVLAFPCRHLCLCKFCAMESGKEWKDCPVCGVELKDLFEVYFP